MSEFKSDSVINSGFDQFAGQANVSQTVPIREQVISGIREAADGLLQVNKLAMRANPMAADLPVFKEVAEIAMRLGSIMQVVSKLRGL